MINVKQFQAELKNAFFCKKCVAENSATIFAFKWINTSSKPIRKNIDGYSINTLIADFEQMFVQQAKLWAATENLVRGLEICLTRGK